VPKSQQCVYRNIYACASVFHSAPALFAKQRKNLLRIYGVSMLANFLALDKLQQSRTPINFINRCEIAEAEKPAAAIRSRINNSHIQRATLIASSYMKRKWRYLPISGLNI